MSWETFSIVCLSVALILTRIECRIMRTRLAKVERLALALSKVLTR